MASKLAIKGRSKDFQYLYAEAMSQSKCNKFVYSSSPIALSIERPSSHKEIKGDVSMVVVGTDHSTDLSYSGRYLSECFQNLYSKTLSL
jgi:hypothetical protein